MSHGSCRSCARRTMLVRSSPTPGTPSPGARRIARCMGEDRGCWAADRDRVTCATYEKRLCERGVVAWRTLEPGQEAGPWIEDFLALEASGWKGRAGSAFAWSDANARFARAALAAA